MLTRVAFFVVTFNTFVEHYWEIELRVTGSMVLGQGCDKLARTVFQRCNVGKSWRRAPQAAH